MKKSKIFLNIIVFIISPVIFAANNTLADFKPGIYLGAQTGRASLNIGDGFEQKIDNEYDTTVSNNVSSSEVQKKIDDTGIGGRGFIGYSFNPYFSLEGGYSLYPDIEYFYNEAAPATICEKIDADTYAIDVIGRAIFPLEKINRAFVGWNIYGKLGVAYINVTYDQTDSSVLTSTITQSASAIRPTYGIGIQYDFTNKFSVDFSWTGIYGKNFVTEKNASFNNDIKAIPTTNFFALGMMYKFTRIE